MSLGFGMAGLDRRGKTHQTSRKGQNTGQNLDLCSWGIIKVGSQGRTRSSYVDKSQQTPIASADASTPDAEIYSPSTNIAGL